MGLPRYTQKYKDLDTCESLQSIDVAYSELPILPLNRGLGI